MKKSNKNKVMSFKEFKLRAALLKKGEFLYYEKGKVFYYAEKN